MPVFTSIATAVLGVGSAWIGITAAGLQVAAGMALSAIGKAMQGEPQAAKFGVQGQLQGGDDVPRSINFGWNCTAGSLVYHSPWGDGTIMSTRVMAIGDLPVRELDSIEVDGVPCTLGSSQTGPLPGIWGMIFPGVVGPQVLGYPVLEYRKNGKDHLWVKFYDGTQTVADPLLVSSVSSAARPYSASRVGRGIPYVVITALAPERKDDGEKPLFQGLPAYKFTTNGVRLYDISKDTTAGGSGSHRWDNPATWGGDGDFLPAVMIYNALRGIRYNGQWVYGLQNTHSSRVDPATFIAAINRCRAGIAGPNGIEPTFRAGGEVQVGAPVNVAIEAWLTACNGRLSESGGTYKLHVGEPGAPVMAFTDGDIISTEEQAFTPFLTLADTINGVSATYPNPAEGWNVKTAPPLLRPDLEVLDGNRRLMASVSLDTVPYHGQVQRLMKWALSEALRARRHTFVLGPEFRALEPGDVVRWSSARNGYVDKLFRVDGIVYRADLDVLVDLTEVDPSDYDWNQSTDYRPVIDGVLNLVGPRPMPMQGWQVFPAILSDEQGRPRRPSIEVWADSGVPSVERVRVQVRVGDENGPLVFDSDSQPYADPWRWILQGQFTPTTVYVVRGIFVGPPLADWSGWLSVTTPDVRLGPLDVIYGDIDLDELGQQFEGLLDWMGGNVRDLIEQAEAQAVLTGDQELANAMQFDQMRRSLTSVVGDLSASFDETITTAIIPMNGKLVALADALTELSAADGDDINSARIRFTAMSGPTGYSRVGIETRFDNGNPDDYRLAGSYWDTPNNPALPTRRIEIADQFVIANSLAGIMSNPFIFDGTAIRVAAGFIADLTSINFRTRSLTADVMAAGTLTSAEINVSQLVASNAFITNLVVRSANIQDLTIGRDKLADGAFADYIGPGTTSGSGNSVTYTSSDFVAGAKPVFMCVSAQVNRAGAPEGSVSVFLDGVSAGTSIPIGGSASTQYLSIALMRSLNNGQTYRLRMVVSNSGTQGSISVTEVAFGGMIPRK